MGIGSGFGKTILFGEHFVVYGLPALASAIGDKTTCTVEKMEGTGYQLNDDRLEIPGYKEKKFDEQKISIRNVIDYMGLNLEEQGLKITLGGNLVCASGVGASAASCVALARAINDEFQMGWDDTKINEAAYNTASTFGGLVYFIRNLENGPNTMETIKLEKPIDMVIASSGMTANTSVVVADVRKKKDENPEWFERIVNEYQIVVKRGREALENMALDRVGEFMNKNHELLQKVTVSNEVLDNMVKIAREAGALGAKVTGTGRGGNINVLTPDPDLQDKVFQALKDAGYAAWKTRIGV
jgi:mevalonate kinase